MSTPLDQMTAVTLGEFARALESLAPQRREALDLVEALVMLWEGAALIIGRNANTAKNRTIRGRAALVAMMAPGGDRQAVLDADYVG